MASDRATEMRDAVRAAMEPLIHRLELVEEEARALRASVALLREQEARRDGARLERLLPWLGAALAAAGFLRAWM